MANKRQWTYFGMPHQFFKTNLMYSEANVNVNTVFYRNMLYAFCKFRSSIELKIDKTTDLQNQLPLFEIEVVFKNNKIRDEFFSHSLASHKNELKEYFSTKYYKCIACQQLNKFINTYFFEIVDDLMSVSQTRGFLLFSKIYPPELVRSYYNVMGIAKLLIDEYNRFLQLRDPYNSFVIKMTQFWNNQIKELPNEILSTVWTKLRYQEPIQNKNVFLKRIAKILDEQKKDFYNEIMYLTCHVDEQGHLYQSGPFDSIYSPIPASFIDFQLSLGIKVPQYKRIEYSNCSMAERYMKYKSLLAEWKTLSEWDDNFPSVNIIQTHVADSNSEISSQFSTLLSRKSHNKIIERSSPSTTYITGSHVLPFSYALQSLQNYMDDENKAENRSSNLIVQGPGSDKNKSEKILELENQSLNSVMPFTEALSIQKTKNHPFLQSDESVENSVDTIPEMEDQSLNLAMGSVTTVKEEVQNLLEEVSPPLRSNVNYKIKYEKPVPRNENSPRIKFLIPESPDSPKEQFLSASRSNIRISSFSNPVTKQISSLSNPTTDAPASPDLEPENVFIYFNNKTFTFENEDDVYDNLKEITEASNKKIIKRENSYETKSEFEYDTNTEFEEFLETVDPKESGVRASSLSEQGVDEDFENTYVKLDFREQQFDDDLKASGFNVDHELHSNNVSVKSEISNQENISSDYVIIESDDDIEMIEIHTKNNSRVQHGYNRRKADEIKNTLLFSEISYVLIKYMDNNSYQSRYGRRKTSDPFSTDDKKEFLKFLYQYRFLYEVSNPSLYEILGHFKFLGRQTTSQYKNFAMELRTNLSEVLQELFTDPSEESTMFEIYQILRKKFG